MFQCIFCRCMDGNGGKLPIAEKLAMEGVNLPSGTMLSKGLIEQIIDKIRYYLGKGMDR